MHTGGIPGFSSCLSFYPAADFRIVILGNGDASYAHELAISYRIVEDLLLLPRFALTLSRNRPPFEMHMDSGTCEFVIEEGKLVGFSLDFYKPPQSRGRGTSIKDSAGVWYERI
jgi:hypothetical protein